MRRRGVTLTDKIALLVKIKNQPTNTSQCQLAEITGVPKSTIVCETPEEIKSGKRRGWQPSMKEWLTKMLGNLLLGYDSMRSNQNVPRILWNRQLGAAWTECYWSFHCSSFTEVARCSLEEAVWQGQGQWFLHHYNAQSHTLPVMQQSLAEKHIPVHIQAPYSPGLAQSDIRLFPTPKLQWYDRTSEDSKKEPFASASRKWQDRWSKCVCAQGSCSIGDVSVAVCTIITV
jgi:hypothetical protein